MEERKGILVSLLAMLCSLLLLGGKCVQDAQNAARLHAEATAIAARAEAHAAGVPEPQELPQTPAPNSEWPVALSVVVSLALIVVWLALIVGALAFIACAYMADEPVPARLTALALLVAALMNQMVMV